ncbi:MAG: hypothetical protein JNK63_01750 [Chthonomonas sp.]|nr:hypothetical protein [Chthonomonas sp.]
MKILTTILILSTLSFAAIGSAHEADCPYCKIKVVQNTKEQDNEVVLKVGNKRIEYRCLYCVIKDQGRYKGDLVVYAPSEKVGEPVILKRTEGKWTGPKDAVYLNTFKAHKDCAALSRAFTTKEAFAKYAKAHGQTEAKPLTLEQFITAITKPAKAAS